MDLALQVIDVVKSLFGCNKITFIPIDFYTTNLVTQNLSKEKKTYLRVVSMTDDSDNSQLTFSGISRTQEECSDKIIFRTLKNMTSDIKIGGQGTQFALLIR